MTKRKLVQEVERLSQENARLKYENELREAGGIGIVKDYETGLVKYEGELYEMYISSIIPDPFGNMKFNLLCTEKTRKNPRTSRAEWNN